MSGIFGLFNQDGAPVEPGELHNMASLLTRRGPDRTGIWHTGCFGAGHTLLATTSEGLREDMPLEHSASGSVITGDVRLDNRPELVEKLGVSARTAVIGDAEIVLAAYLQWGEDCVERLLGDFAFAIWSPRHHTLFCARDHMGMRSIYYHHSPGRFFAFATEPRAILVLPRTPYRINDRRIADYLVNKLEGIDKTSTFFEGVFRLPPAHTMTVTPDGIRQRRYWTLEPGPELRLPSNEAYAEAFLEVFTEAVHCRLRTVGPAGSMLSGGIDSGSVVAVASRLLATENRGPLRTFSAISPDGHADVETRTIQAALTMDGLDPCTVSCGKLDELLPELEQLTRDLDEPFDGYMTLVRAVYLTAHRRGLKMLLDGAGGDTVLSEGSRLARLLRSAHWRTAYREAAAQNRFWNGGYPPGRELVRSACAAFVPDVALRRVHRQRQRLGVGRTVRGSLISEDFARQVALAERLSLLESHSAAGPVGSSGAERARAIDDPYLTVGRERYDRVAAAVGMEPRDPFLDLRVMSFCVRLPDRHTLDNGWPKAILRRATAGRLPDAVRWRRGKEHLGWAFTEALMTETRDEMRDEVEANLASVGEFVDVNKAQSVLRAYFEDGDATRAEDASSLIHLARWLRRHAERPRAASSIRDSERRAL